MPRLQLQLSIEFTLGEQSPVYGAGEREIPFRVGQNVLVYYQLILIIRNQTGFPIVEIDRQFCGFPYCTPDGSNYYPDDSR